MNGKLITTIERSGSKYKKIESPYLKNCLGGGTGADLPVIDHFFMLRTGQAGAAFPDNPLPEGPDRRGGRQALFFKIIKGGGNNESQ